MSASDQPAVTTFVGAFSSFAVPRACLIVTGKPAPLPAEPADPDVALEALSDDEPVLQAASLLAAHDLARAAGPRHRRLDGAVRSHEAEGIDLDREREGAQPRHVLGRVGDHHHAAARAGDDLLPQEGRAAALDLRLLDRPQTGPATVERAAENIAAVIVEPMSGSAGVILPPVGYLQRLREITDPYVQDERAS